jgi:hypothetical protein
MVTLFVIIFLNVGFMAVLFSVSRFYKVRFEDYLFNLICLNLVVVLMYASKYFDVLMEYPMSVRFFSSIAVIYIIAEPFRRVILKQLRVSIEKFRH